MHVVYCYAYFLLIALEKVLNSTAYLLSNIDLLDKFSEAVSEKEMKCRFVVETSTINHEIDTYDPRK